MFFVTLTYVDGTESRAEVSLDRESRWTYVVPDGVCRVAGLPVRPGDTVSGLATIA